MPDSSSSSTSSSSSEAAPKPKGYFNKAQLEDIEVAEDIHKAASAASRAAAFAGQDISAEYLTGLAAAIAQARAKTTETGQDADEGQAATINAGDAEKELVVLLQKIQSAAKQKHRMLAEDDDPETNFSLDGYLFNRKLNISRALLLQNAAALKTKAENDSLPGFKTPEAIQSITDAIEAYGGATGEQKEGDVEAGEDRGSRDKLIRKINARRIAIQHAADAIWPYTGEGNGPVRTLFHLPKSRPMTE